MNKIEDIEIEFIRNTSSERPHNKKVIREKCFSSSIRRGFLTNRDATLELCWNNLPEKVINAKSLNSFKARLDDHFDS